MGKSIMQDWVSDLGLRHQGVLVAAIRGCDGAPKDDACKLLTRFYRACILTAHCGDPRKARSFMIWCNSREEFWALATPFLSDFDQYPNHFVMHLLHSTEVLGYYHPDLDIREWWRQFYGTLVKKMHLNIETKAELDARLNPGEAEFADQQRAFGE